jgi:very-short-patch-repair endonuclease
MGDIESLCRLDRIAGRQLGLFTRAQAVASGYSPFQIRRRVRRGDWLRVYGAALAYRGCRLTSTVRAAAVHLAVPGSVLAGPTAAWWYGLDAPSDPVHLWLGPANHRRLPDVRSYRDPLSPDDVRRADGMAVTGPGRTVFDCLRVLPEAEAATLLDRALQRGWTSMAELVSRTRAHVGRRGAPRLVRLLRTVGNGTRSPAERQAVAILRSAGISGWLANAEIRDGRGVIGFGDLVFPAARLVVELDGWAHHSDPVRFQHDRTRQNRLVAAGWTVLRFTWRDLVERPADVVAEIGAALGRLAAA